MQSLNLGWKIFDQNNVVWGGGGSTNLFSRHFSTENKITPKTFLVCWVVGEGAKYKLFLSFQLRKHIFIKTFFVVAHPPPRNYKFAKDAKIKGKERKKLGRRKGRREKGRRE